MNIKTKTVLSIAAACAAIALFGANFPLGTYVYTGSVLDSRHEVLSAAAGLTIQAVSSDGTVLASSRVTDPAVSSGINFRLEVPVSKEASDKSAAIGDELKCVAISDGGSTNISLRALPPVAAANAITNISVVNASAKSFDCGDGTSVLVSDAYLAGLAPLMRASGKTAYDPVADWDGDGIPNYGEYKAGTNPFDASDRLRITAFRPDGDSTLLKFEYAGGHLYAVDSTPSLMNRTWQAEPFRVDSPSAAVQRTFSVPGTEDVDIGEATVYLVPASSEPSMFYTIRAE